MGSNLMQFIYVYSSIILTIHTAVCMCFKHLCALDITITASMAVTTVCNHHFQEGKQLTMAKNIFKKQPWFPSLKTSAKIPAPAKHPKTRPNAVAADWHVASPWQRLGKKCLQSLPWFMALFMGISGESST